jgi:putative acetyltransferase
MDDFRKLTISTFHPEDQDEVKNLVLAGLVEHWGWLDSSKNPDLDDIAMQYASGVFFIARQAGRLVGTGALIPRQDGIAEIVRMSVAKDVRRQGIGKKILSELVNHARQAGFKRLILETTTTWQEVVEFYLHCGFRITHRQDGDTYFALDL